MISPAVNDRLQSAWQGANDWVSSGVVSSPGANAVLVDSGPLGAGSYLVQVMAWSDTAMTYDIQLRDAANGATIDFQRRAVAANGNDDATPGSKILVTTNQRVRVILATGSASPANCTFSLFYVEVPQT